MMGMRARLAVFGHQSANVFATRDITELAELDRRVMEIVEGDRKLAADRFQALTDLIVQAARAIATGRT